MNDLSNDGWSLLHDLLLLLLHMVVHIYYLIYSCDLDVFWLIHHHGLLLLSCLKVSFLFLLQIFIFGFLLLVGLVFLLPNGEALFIVSDLLLVLSVSHLDEHFELLFLAICQTCWAVWHLEGSRRLWLCGGWRGRGLTDL